jgi:integrase
MDKRTAKLTALQVERLTKPGHYGDGLGLYLQVNANGQKSWIFRYERLGRERYMGLGPLHKVSLVNARDAAREARQCLVNGEDPLEKKRRQIEEQQREEQRNLRFDACVALYLQAHADAWRNAKHRQQWENTLRTYVSPHFGSIPARQVATEHVLKALEPIWSTKTETASRVRERIERVLSWAATRGYREGDNPARWVGHLEMLLPAPAKLKKVKHHAALPFSEVAMFFELLGKEEGTAARALEFTILTAGRSGEVLGATWDEIDLAAGVWTIPPERMKAGRAHRVPLVSAAIALLRRQAGRDLVRVFPGARKGKPLSGMAMPVVLRRLGRKTLTVHGFRSTFRDWAAEQTDYPRELAEVALAHTVGSAVEKAYRRGDMFERRRRLMEDWTEWCTARAPQGKLSSTAQVEAPSDASGLTSTKVQRPPPRHPDASWIA